MPQTPAYDDRFVVLAIERGFEMRARFLLLAIPLVLAALGGRAMAGELSLGQVSAYFNSLGSVTADFTQNNPDGSTTGGTLFIKRPGRIRFEYDPPEEAMVIAGGGSLAVFDPRSNQGPARYPLNQTPLHIILEQTVDLSRERMVVNHTFDGTFTRVTAQDPDHPEYGSIELVFADPPLLAQWIIRDNAGGRTVVNLERIQLGGNVPNRLFNITYAERQWNAR